MMFIFILSEGKPNDEIYWAASSDQGFWGNEGLRNQVIGVLVDYIVMLSYGCDKTWRYIGLEISIEKNQENHYTSEVQLFMVKLDRELLKKATILQQNK